MLPLRKNSDESGTTRTSDVFDALVRKPATKPDFRMPIQSNSVLNQVRDFLPAFKQRTEELLQDPNCGRGIEIIEQKDIKEPKHEESRGCNCGEEHKECNDGKQMVEMSLGLGLYDINNPNYDESSFKPGSLAPMMMINKEKKKGDGESSDSDSSSFENDEEMERRYEQMVRAFNTQSGGAPPTPLVQDITKQ